MKHPVNIDAQFAKLCPGQDGDRLKIVRDARDAMRSLGSRGHWAYNLSRHQALKELYDAMLIDGLGKRSAA